MNVKIKKLHKDAIIPKYQTEGSAAFDICSNMDAKIYYHDYIPKTMIRTGISIEVPKGYVLSIRQRSGLSKIYPNYLAIGVGTVDSDYRGEIFIPVVNRNRFSYTWIIKRGDRIVQGIIHPIVQVEFEEVNELSETERGEDGFGSTGK